MNDTLKIIIQANEILKYVFLGSSLFFLFLIFIFFAMRYTQAWKRLSFFWFLIICAGIVLWAIFVWSLKTEFILDLIIFIFLSILTLFNLFFCFCLVVSCFIPSFRTNFFLKFYIYRKRKK